MSSLKNSPGTQEMITKYNLTVDEIYAIVVYTFDINLMGPTKANFYYNLNEILRTRKREDMEAMQGYMYYLMKALQKLPNFQGTVYRGNSNIDIVKREYTIGREVYWSSFSSTSVSQSVARAFAGDSGVVFRIKCFTGKCISRFSAACREEEVLLPPNSCLFVPSGVVVQEEENGTHYLDLVEKTNKFRW
eukprot:TRINITY_DN1198_c0_g1_i1.p1 TRINITY_DN1198_c0_g1~~TRINITY_DN1198_c0_g1_i1.p1  ORF type:complete len:190 (-),score=45.31 TRINITY_DN1198_c0_g1_i1:72-641(-)